MNLEDYFGLFADADNAVYWKSADGQTILIGLGIADTCEPANMTKLHDWQEKQPVPVFGGFSFDAEIPVNQQPLLADFIAPKVVIDVMKNHIMGDADYLKTLQEESGAQSQSGLALARIIVAEDSDTDWEMRVTQVIEELQVDATKQKVVLGTQKQITLSSPLDQRQLLHDLMVKQPNSYHIVLKRDKTLFVSATPERLVAVKDNMFATAAVAGSAPRGQTPAEDKQLGVKLIDDVKNREEHALVVHEIGNRLADIANVSWADTPIMLQTPQIQHLYTPITGQLQNGRYILDVVMALHPTPALGGVPRAWAMQTIKDVERYPRGLFAAPIGVVWPNGDGEFVIGIRAMVVTNKTAILFAGAGILAASNAAQEWAEINLKMTPMLELIKEQVND